ncbi:MAG: type III pantothenate kinase [Flavobacteriales bacterium]
MNLCIDIGNTRIKAGLFENNSLEKIFISESLISNSLVREWTKNAPVDRIILSTVRTIDASIIGELKTEFTVLILDQNTSLPVTIQYETRDTLGLDRICAAVAAHDMFPHLPVLAIDAGTCITYELIDHEGNYLGGAISPGIKMRAKSLNAFTSKLPLIELKGEKVELGTTTESSLQMGIVDATRFEMKGFITHFRRRFENLKVILTGGDSGFFEQDVENAIFAAPNLVLQGLNSILLYNKPA